MSLFAQTEFTPAQVEDVLRTAFPKATIFFQNLSDVEWEQWFNVGFFRVTVHAYQHDRLGARIGDVQVLLEAVEYSNEHVLGVLWSQSVNGLDNLAGVLQEVREHLLGVTAALAFICEQKNVQVAKPVPPPTATGVVRNPRIPPDRRGSLYPSVGGVDLNLPAHDRGADLAVDALLNGSGHRRLQARQPKAPPIPTLPRK